ncbi:hypothetical protein FACS1894214_2750 [Planctomycetales bacterium]|nr:hypothetical protein FACS1894214_2750 [Planctomycetales bacterium]
MRLVIAKVIDPVSQKELACWYLLTNVGEDVSSSTVALWYYHRWRIESYFKLLKSGGQELEHWQQESGLAILKRLLVVSDGSGGGLEFAAKRECGGGGVQAGVSPIERKVAEAAETAVGGNVAVRFVCVIENI